MKIAALLAVIILLAGCKKEGNDPMRSIPVTSQDLELTFTNTVDGTPLVLGSISYTNAASNKYSVNLLRYYVSNIELLRADGSVVYTANNYNLIDAANVSQRVIMLKDVPVGSYTSLRFKLGVDSAHNHTGAQEGFLDPSYGMLWTWNTGYIFFKHEGQFLDKDSTIKPLRLHLGTDAGLADIAVPVDLTLGSAIRKAVVQFNLNTAYHGADTIDFNIDNNRQSSASTDGLWINKMRTNLASAFTITIAP